MPYGKWFIWFITGCWLIMIIDWLMRRKIDDEN